jgi:phosphate transport system permease protein
MRISSGTQDGVYPSARPRRELHYGDRVFAIALKLPSIALVGLLALIGIFLFAKAEPSIRRFGFDFFGSTVWDPVREIFGAAPVIYGTVVSSLLAVMLATPLSVGVALCLNELAPRRVSQVLGFLVEMLAAIPSVVYGLWGIFVLAPWLRVTVQPALGSVLGFLPFFQGTPRGIGMMAAGMILAIMITPTISSIAREVFRAVPRDQKEAALALGATHWEMMRLAILKSSRAGVFGAVTLGLGRALGETMAVTMLIGNQARISASLFAPGQTMASAVANEYAEATGGLHLGALMELGLCLFLVTFVINGSARLLIWRLQARKVSQAARAAVAMPFQGGR